MQWKTILEMLNLFFKNTKPEGQPVERGVMIPVTKIWEFIKKHRRKTK